MTPTPNNKEQGMDYEQLLRKYMAHLRCVEGIDFTDRASFNESAHEVAFTREEVAALTTASEAGQP